MKAHVVTIAALCLAACGSSGDSSSSGNPGSSGDSGAVIVAPTDADRDGFAVSADCNDNDATVWHSIDVFADLDRDSFGAGARVSICVGATTPAGYSSSSTDCADDNAAVHAPMSYAARDADGDMFLVASAGSVCTNGVALPATYFATAASGAVDCDDMSASVWRLIDLHEDFDRDGVGHGAPVSLCLGAGSMPGFVASSFDCAHLDATRWRMVATYIDIDGDGVGSGAIQHSCVGAAPPPGSSFKGFDPLDTTVAGSALVSDFELKIAGLFVESEADDDDLP